MESISQVKKWIELYCGNTYETGKKIYTTEFTVKVPESITNYLMSKQSKEQIYVGTTVQSDTNENTGVTNNFLVLLTISKVNKLYYITNTYYRINPKVVIDIEKYSKAKKCTKLNIGLTDLINIGQIFYDTGSYLNGQYVKTRISVTPNFYQGSTSIYSNGIFQGSASRNFVGTNSIVENSEAKYLYTNPSIYYLISKL